MKRIKMMFATCVALFAVTSLVAQTAGDAATKYNEAVELIKAKKYAEAIPVLEQAADLGLDNEAMEVTQAAQKQIPTCNFQAGLALAQAGKMEEALPFLNAANDSAELYGNTSVARNAKTMISRVYTGLGADAFNNKDYAKAAEIFAKGYEANNQDTDLALNLAMSYSEMGDLTKGIDVYKQIISLEGKNPKFDTAVATAKEKVAYYLSLKASEQAQSGDVDAAYATIDQLLAVDPLSTSGHMLRLQTATNAKAWDKIIEWGDIAAEAQTDDTLKSNAYFLLGAAYDSKDNNAKAIETYGKVAAGDNAAAAKARIAELKALAQ